MVIELHSNNCIQFFKQAFRFIYKCYYFRNCSIEKSIAYDACNYLKHDYKLHVEINNTKVAGYCAKYGFNNPSRFKLPKKR